jgi:archaeosortase C (PEF-CTERM variant)
MFDYKNIILFLLIFALFLGATVEISEGSIFLGILLFIIAIILISRIKVGKSYVIKQSKLHMFVGALIVASDIAYNILTHSELGTLDIMTFLLGISLIAYDINNEEISRMGKFGAYMSATFIVLFLFFFSLFNHLNIDFTHTFDHYFVLLPSVFLIKTIGIPIHVIATETVRIQGVEDMSVIIGGTLFRFIFDVSPDSTPGRLHKDRTGRKKQIFFTAFNLGCCCIHCKPYACLYALYRWFLLW